MMSAGVMVMRSKASISTFYISINIQHIAWVSFLISLSAFFRDRPSVSQKPGKGPWMAIMISCSSLIVAYMYFTPPLLLLSVD